MTLTLVGVERPFRGLRYFDEPDAHLFFGRDEQIDDLLITLRRSRFVAVIGSSGSGKSSLVRAGLVPGLRAGFLVEAGGDWRVVITLPGHAPIGNFARNLERDLGLEDAEITLRRGPLGLVEAVRQARLAPGQNLLVIVDQFEELFRYQRESARPREAADESSALVKLLLEAAAQRDLPIYVVLTLRSDFLGNCAQFRDLPERLNDGLYVVPRMRRDQIQIAITGPLGVVGVAVTPRLVQRLLNDVGDDPDQLPVLQHALLRTWERWKHPVPASDASGTTLVAAVATGPRPAEGALDLEHYEATGTLERSLSDHATEIYDALPESQRKTATALFQRLIDRDAENRDVRRRATVGEIAAVVGTSEQEVSSVIDAFAADGVWLLARNGDLVDVTHESLIRKWHLIQGTPDRKGWLQEEVDARDVFLELAARARRRQSDLDLLDGTDLDRALSWRGLGLGWPWASRYVPDRETFQRVIALVDDSKRTVDAERRAAADAAQRAAEAKERQRRRALGLAALALLVATAVSLLAIVAWRLKVRADTQADALRISTIVYGAAAVLPRDPTAAALVLNHARTQGAPWIVAQLANGTATRTQGAPWIAAQVASSTAQEPLAAAVLRSDTGPITAGAFSPDGKKVVTGSLDGSTRIWQADGNGTPLVLRAGSTAVRSVAFNPDGSLFATGSDDGTVRVWRADGGADARVLRGSSFGPVTTVRFTAHGKRLVAANGFSVVRGWQVDDNFRPVRLAPPDSGLSTAGADNLEFIGLVEDGPRVLGVAFGEFLSWCLDGACQPKRVRILRAPGALADSPIQSWNMKLSPDGRRLLVNDSTLLRLLCVEEECEPITLGQFGNLAVVSHTAFNRTGSRVAATESQRVVVWDLQNRDATSAVVSYTIPEPGAASIRFHPDGWRVFVVFRDGTTQLLGGHQPVVFRGHRSSVTSASFDANGTRLLTTSEDGTARMWPVDTREPSVLPNSPAPARAAMFDAAGQAILAVGAPSQVKIWKSASPSPLTWNAPVQNAWFSADGARVLGSITGRGAVVWQPADGREVVLPGSDGQIITASFSGDGRRLAAAWLDGTVRVWTVDDPARSVMLAGRAATVPGSDLEAALFGEPVAKVVFDQSSNLVAVAAGAVVRVFPAGGTSTPTIFSGHTGRVLDVAFSPDGTRLVSAGDDGMARVWPVDTDRPASSSGRERANAAAAMNAVLKGHSRAVISAVFSPDGTRVLTASTDATARVWSADGKGDPVVLIGHSGALTHAAFSPRGERVVTTSQDGTARVWDAGGRGEILSLPHYRGGAVNQAEFSPDGERVVTASVIGVRVWQVTLGPLLNRLQNVTTACLEAPERRRFLAETQEQASAGYDACERGHGRKPPAAPAPSPASPPPGKP